jgi:rhodanese-related sulfurtransferase
VGGFKIMGVAELNRILQQSGAESSENLGFRLIDVRTDAEVAGGKIARGESIPLHLLPLRLGELDKNSTTVFYCQMGGRSAQAATFALSQGFVDVYNVEGGITAWRIAGFPTV